MVARVARLISFPLQMTLWVAPLPITSVQAPGLHESIVIILSGGGKAVDSVKSLCTALKFEIVADPVLVQNAPDAKAKKALAALGHTLATMAQK